MGRAITFIHVFGYILMFLFLYLIPYAYAWSASWEHQAYFSMMNAEVSKVDLQTLQGCYLN